MKTSETITKIAEALLTAQKAISFAAKDAKNPHFKNTYADLPAVVNAVKPALNDAGIVFIQSGSPSDDGRLHLTTRLLHSSGEFLEDTLVMPLPKQDPQGYGSAMTYARRYALAAIAGLYQDDDDGNAGSGVPEVKHKPARTQPTGLTDGTRADFMAEMDAASSIEELRAATSAAMAAAKAAGDTAAHNEFKNAGLVKAQKFEGANA